MGNLALVGDDELLAQLPALCSRERRSTADVVVFLAEVDRRRLYLGQACSSLYSFCIERLGYSEDAALKRVRVARLFRAMPQILDDLTSGAIHLTGLFLLSNHLSSGNADKLLAEARGKTRREIERLLACWFPKPDVFSSVTPLAPAPRGSQKTETGGLGGVDSTGPGTRSTCLGTGTAAAFPGTLGTDAAFACSATGAGSACPETGSGSFCGGTGTASTCPETGKRSTWLETGTVAGCVGARPGSTCSETGAVAGFVGTGRGSTCPGTGDSAGGQGDAPREGARARVEPLSAHSYRVEFTASAELCGKLEQVQDLLSHAVAPADLGAIFERGLDALIAVETKRRRGGVSDKARKRKALKEGSRHVPVDVAREVWDRDEHRCAFVDEVGRRCDEKRYLTLEHVDPHARGGPPTAENLCLLCKPHNQDAARREFGAEHVERRTREAQSYAKVGRALVANGFSRQQAKMALDTLRRQGTMPDVQVLLRQALAVLVPARNG